MIRDMEMDGRSSSGIKKPLDDNDEYYCKHYFNITGATISQFNHTTFNLIIRPSTLSRFAV